MKVDIVKITRANNTDTSTFGHIYADKTKQMVMLELTVPREEHMDEAHERKLGKYL